jgi:hypothetical protein
MPFKSEDYHDDFEESNYTGHSREIHQAIIRGNVRLFQLVRPEKLFLVHKDINRYTKYALLAQEHFSCIVFLKMLMKNLRSKMNAGMKVESKWKIYTRTSPELLFLSDKLQDRGIHMREKKLKHLFISYFSFGWNTRSGI